MAMGMGFLLGSIITIIAKGNFLENQASVEVFMDFDQDGLPDSWEKENGLNPVDPLDRWSIAPNGFSNIQCYVMRWKRTEPPAQIIRVGTSVKADMQDLAAALEKAEQTPGTVIKVQRGLYDLNFDCESNIRVMVIGGWDERFESSNPATMPTVLGKIQPISWNLDKAKQGSLVFSNLVFEGDNPFIGELHEGSLLKISDGGKRKKDIRMLIENCIFRNKTNAFVDPNVMVNFNGIRWFLIANTLFQNSHNGFAVKLTHLPLGYHQIVNSTFQSQFEQAGAIQFEQSDGKLSIINSILDPAGAIHSGNKLEIKNCVATKLRLQHDQSGDRLLRDVSSSSPLLDGKTGQLQPGSPALGLAEWSLAPPIDYFGVSRRRQSDYGYAEHTFTDDQQPFIAFFSIGNGLVRWKVMNVAPFMQEQSCFLTVFFQEYTKGDVYFVDLTNKILSQVPVMNKMLFKKAVILDFSDYAGHLPSGNYEVISEVYGQHEGQSTRKPMYTNSMVFHK